ncbi:hypothetical protein HBI17_219230 [Parastagonospora nodorum]|nr:hypothetical protein HBI17_219230 [Parastagonospora nodorum]
MDLESCLHKDVRQFDNMRCCMACGESLHLWQVAPRPQTTEKSSDPELCNASSRLSHAYNDLRLTTGTSIRLILLQPGDFQDPLSCIIATVDPYRENYDAISYTWATESGHDRKTGRIHCPDGAIAITENCEAALRTLRLPIAPRQLWVDAICINQSNVDERNHQVELMEQIYRLASTVHICIQDTTHSYTECIAWLNGQGDSSREAATQTAELFRRRYFTRVWIIQEITLAKQVTLHVNRESVLLSDLTLRRAISISLEFNLQSGVPLILRSIQNPSGNIAKSIFRCLRLSLVASSADIRDKVYGIVSLLKPDIRGLIPVDYDMDHTTVFGNVIMACIAEQRDLRILQLASLSTQVNNAADACCFGMQELKNYVSNPLGPSTCCWTRRIKLQQFGLKFQSCCRWVPKVMVVTKFSALRPRYCSYDARSKVWKMSRKSLKPSRARNTPIPIMFLQYSRVQKISRMPPAQQILPRLHVRGHLIDVSHGSSSDTTTSTSETVQQRFEDLALARHPWLAGIFREEKLPCIDGIDGSKSSNLITTNEQDLRSFLSYARCCNKPGPAIMFQSYYSVGFSDVRHPAGDHIFAIDSIPELLMLRQVEPNVFRVVGTCYLWAAVELDYWKPGSRKGRWPDRPYDLGNKQTRMIEIY